MSAFLTKAYDKDRNEVDIDDAHSGEYFCEICGSPLIARNKKPLDQAKRAHHFAHRKNAHCEATDETILHKRAKEVILKERALMFPKTEVPQMPSGFVRFIKVEEEIKTDNFNLRPDITATLENGEQVFIEFAVSHRVTTKNRDIIVKNNLKFIEIDLNYIGFEKNTIRSFLLETENDRKWVTKPTTRLKDTKGLSASSARSIWHIRAIEYIKKLFDENKLEIGWYGAKYNLKELKYDCCERNNRYRRFSADLIISRSKEDDIAISIRGRRRNTKSRIPDKLRVIDIIIRNEDGFKELCNDRCLYENYISDNLTIIYNKFDKGKKESSKYNHWNENDCI